MIDPNIALEAAAGAITAVGGIYGAIRKYIRHSKAKKEDFKNSILDHAKRENDRIKEDLEFKIKALEADLESHKADIDKDFNFLKQTYSNEIKNLGDKIETLRDELRMQSSGILTLLTKLIENK